MPISFRQLEVFRAVADLKSFTRASQKLLISQSTVSEHIRQLEEVLMTRVFDRSQRITILTPAGKRLHAYTMKIFTLLEEAELAAKNAPDEFAGRLTIGCGSTTILYLLSPVLKAFVKAYPKVELSVRSYHTIQPMMVDLQAGAIEFAIVILPVSGPDLVSELLAEEPFFIVLPAKHPAARKKPSRIRELLSGPVILYRRASNTRKIIDQFFHKMKITPHIVMQLEDTEAMKEMVASGFGVSLLPASAFLVHGRESELARIPVAPAKLKRGIGLIHIRSRALPPIAIAFTELLKNEFHRFSAAAHTNADSVELPT